MPPITPECTASSSPKREVPDSGVKQDAQQSTEDTTVNDPEVPTDAAEEETVPGLRYVLQLHHSNLHISCEIYMSGKDLVKV